MKKYFCYKQMIVVLLLIFNLFFTLQCFSSQSDSFTNEIILKTEVKDTEGLAILYSDKVIGKGAIANVHAGVIANRGEDIAVKVIMKNKITSKLIKINIENEIYILKKVDHKNLLKFRGVGQDENSVYIVTELAKGGDLFDHILNEKLNQKQIFSIFSQILDGVEYIHSLGFAHHDLKPENILMDQKKIIMKIADFGMVEKVKKDQLSKFCGGSKLYVSPEKINCIMKKIKFNPYKSDIWSLGVILYALATKNLPFSTKKGEMNLMPLFSRIKEGDVKFRKKLNSDLQDLIEKILEVDPDKRLGIKQIKDHPWYKTIKDGLLNM